MGMRKKVEQTDTSDCLRNHIVIVQVIHSQKIAPVLYPKCKKIVHSALIYTVNWLKLFNSREGGKEERGEEGSKRQETLYIFPQN